MNNLIKAIGISCLLALAVPSFAQVSFDIRIGPPPPRHEVVVAAPYPEAVWIPGFHRWDYATQAYVWVPGRWDRPPHPGFVWVAPRYPHRGGRYGFVAGHWAAPGRGGRAAYGGRAPMAR